MDSLESMLQSSSTRGKKGRGEGKGAKRLAVERPGEPASSAVNVPRAVVSFRGRKGVMSGVVCSSEGNASLLMMGT